jgi:hypothetical protein
MLSDKELEILSVAKKANPHWFKALINAAEIMAQRRQKYAGQNHPYFNFVDMSYRLDTDMSTVFKFYLNIKAFVYNRYRFCRRAGNRYGAGYCQLRSDCSRMDSGQFGRI